MWLHTGSLGATLYKHSPWPTSFTSLVFNYIYLCMSVWVCGHMWVGGHACAWTWRSEEGVWCPIPLLYACISEVRSFPGFEAGASDRPASSSEPSCLCLALSWSSSLLQGIPHSLIHECLDLNSGLPKFGVSTFKLWVISLAFSSLLLLLLKFVLFMCPFVYYPSFTVLLAHENDIFVLGVDGYKLYA